MDKVQGALWNLDNWRAFFKGSFFALSSPSYAVKEQFENECTWG